MHVLDYRSEIQPGQGIIVWYVILSKPRQEQRAATNLVNQGGNVYLPMLSVERIKNGKRIRQDEPLFPGYLFLKSPEQEGLINKVRSTFGVRGLLRFGDQPVTIADELIQDIRQRSENPAPIQSFKPGQQVQIDHGPFRDYQAIFHSYNGEERAIILISLLGQQNKLLVQLSDLA